MFSKKMLLFVSALGWMAGTSWSGVAQSGPTSTKGPTGYDRPEKKVLDVMHAPQPPVPIMSPTGDKMFLAGHQRYPSIERVAAPYLRLAGVRVETGNHSKHDTPGGYGITGCDTSFNIVSVPSGSVTKVTLPAGCPQDPEWLADGKKFAFTNLAKDSVELWVGNATTGAVRRIPGIKLNPMFGDAVQWMPDQQSLLVKLVPAGIGAPPADGSTPVGPSIQETGGAKGESSTYENRDTLNNTHDEDLFDYYAASQLAVVNASTGAVTLLGKPGNLDGMSPAPDGKHILVSSIHKPYSYVTTYDRFPHEVEVWDVTDRAHVTKHTMASQPLADRVPVRGVPMGPRDFEWRAQEPATLIWAEAQDKGDWKVKVPARDKVMLQKAPFSVPPVEVIRTEQRFARVLWGQQPGVAMMYEYDNNKHMIQTEIVDVDHPQAKPHMLWKISSDERYANPGTPVLRQLPDGSWVMRQEGDSIYLQGLGASPEGDRPFLDRYELTSGKAERLFRSDRNSLDRFLAFSGPGSNTFLTWHQSLMDPPNAYLRTLGKPVTAVAGEPVLASTSVAVTHVPDPTPEVRKIKTRLVKYKRADGVDLSFTLFTPPDYKEGTRVPAILYAYPADYADPSKAGQVSGSEQRFTQLLQYKLLLLEGYAIIDNASFPVVGDPQKAYDTYLEQLVADAKAAVDKAVEIGVVDPNRVGVTGHSHGALMTANLVAHTNLFKAGAATSGSYNKTLTPFGFQNEQRSVWAAQDVYLKVSPFFVADKMKVPLLIVHGAEDANPGTTPLQSVKLYEAIRGNGGTAKLVLLPHEPHWYTAMESNEQLIYEMIHWFDKYVKNAPAAK